MGWWGDNHYEPGYESCDDCQARKYSCRCEDKWCGNPDCDAREGTDLEGYDGMYQTRKSECNCKPEGKMGDCSKGFSLFFLPEVSKFSQCELY